MKLIELLSVIDVNCKVSVFAYDAEDPDLGVEVGYYDGKNSIDPDFNDSEIEFVTISDDGTIDITIDEEV